MLVFRHVYGFLLQILPCVFFCCYPFADYFKVSSRKAAGILLFLLLFLCTVFTCAGTYFFSSLPVRINHELLNILSYLSLAVLLFACCLLIHASVFEKLFVFFVVICYGFMTSEFTAVLLHFFQPLKAEGHSICESLWVMLHSAITLLLFYPMLYLLRKVRRAFPLLVDSRLWRHLALIPATFALIVIFCVYIPRQTDMNPEIILLLFMPGCFGFMYFLCNWLFMILEHEKKQAEAMPALRLMLDNYRRSAENTQKIREMRHEIKHHMNAVSLYLKAQNYSGAEHYVEKWSNSVSKGPTEEYTPHPLINSILFEYHERGKVSGVRIAYRIVVPARIYIEDTDLCCLLTNMLDNALEGCAHVEQMKRYVTLKIKKNGQFLFFACENSCQTGGLNIVNGQFLSTKNDAGNHGLGIPCMRSIARQYNGLFRAESSGDTFTTYVNLCLQE